MEVQLVFVERRRLHFLHEHRTPREDGLGRFSTNGTGGPLALIAGDHRLGPAVAEDLFRNDGEPELRSRLLFAEILPQGVAVDLHGLEYPLVPIFVADALAEQIAFAIPSSAISK